MTVAIFLGSLLGSMAIGVPIAFALILCGVALMLFLGMFDAQIVSQNLVSGADSFQLLAIPFFLVAGEFMNAGGLSRRIVDLATSLVGHFRGGLGYVAVLAAIVMASMSGSAVADTAAVGAMLIPMMRKAGYDVNRSAGLIAAGGIIAPVIPPSIPFIIFGVAAGVSVKKLFMAGIAPGLMMALFLVATWWLVSRKDAVPVSPRQPLRVIGRRFKDGIWALMIPLLIIVGIKEGIFTPTEAGVVAAVYSLFVGMVVYRELKPAQLFGLLLAAGRTTAVVMFLVAAAGVAAWLITIADLPQTVIAILEPLIDRPILLMAVIMVIVVIVGTALDLVPTILILTPVLMPLIKQAGIDPVYFGVLFIMNNAIGLITPPVGTVLNVICGVSRITMDDVMKGVWPFLLAHLLLLALLTLFPSLVLVPMAWFMGN
ncbi:Sialic acid TRAP transporter permease protein SiaT [Paracoccus haematequi]|jgi:TRAP transporter, DctM subunit|uniref:TRAP transporter large permease protein n=1 Tax=Paracoccus haematequi TaxID=2491866 RepID=A0A447IMN5_9RHOB|nr:TRAP transporter large permease subunit [Paracoccus haematequi]VDS08802.1 Sialic acid TRAP transporter permease protein SiaT [Paracoccus haematequi]